MYSLLVCSKGSDMVNPTENVFICGDSFSSHQAWMEGALETSELVIKSIFKK